MSYLQAQVSSETREQGTIAKFYHHKPVASNEIVYVSGNISELGNWDPQHAFELSLTKGNNWRGEIHLPTPCEFEYKYFIADSNKKNVIWDQGSNATMRLSPDAVKLFNNAGKEMRVMTFNIRYLNDNDGRNHWNNRKELVAGIMDKYASDFIGLQEANTQSIKRSTKQAS